MCQLEYASFNVNYPWGLQYFSQDKMMHWYSNNPRSNRLATSYIPPELSSLETRVI